jgi:hypothetical protein
VDQVDEGAPSQHTWGVRLLPLSFLLLTLLIFAGCTDSSGDDDSADDNGSASADDDDALGDDDDATELPPVDDVSALVDSYWLLDLSEAEYVEPPNMEFLLAASMGDLALLVGLTPDSDLPNGVAHVLGALGDLNTKPVSQDLCQASQPFTAGPDGSMGTSDDLPGEFINPAVRLSRFDYPLVTRGTVVPLTNVRLEFGITADGQALERGRLRATMDTRPIALDVLNNEDPYAGCEIIFEASQRECFECGGDNPGNFCIDLEVAAIPGTREGAGLIERSCEEIIAEDVADTGCDGKASRYEREGEEGYPLCPAYTGER